MSARSPKKTASPELVQVLDATDGLDLFATDAAPVRSAVPARHAGRGKYTSLVDVPRRVDDTTAPEMEVAAPELVWLEATDGLEDFAQPPNRSLSRFAATAMPAGEGQPSPWMDVPIAPPQAIARWTGRDVARHQSRFAWMKRVGLAALLGSALAAAADGLLDLQPPAAPLSVDPQAPAIVVSETAGPLAAGGRPDVADPPSVPTEALRADDASGPAAVVSPAGEAPSDVQAAPRVTARSGSPAGSAPASPDPPRRVVAIESPADAADAPAPSTPTVVGGRAPSVAAVVAAATLAPPAAASEGPSTPPANPAPVLAGPSAAAPSPAETPRAAATDGPSPEAGAGSPGRDLEARAIENVLGRYRSAFNRLDAGAALAVWPTVNAKTLARAFERLEGQDVSFERCQIEIVALRAEAACSGSARYVPKVGSRTAKVEARRWSFSLRKAGDGWLIDRVDAR